MGSSRRFCVGLGLIGALVLLSMLSSSETISFPGTVIEQASTPVPTTDHAYRDEEILAKVAKQPVKSRFTPVFVYQIMDRPDQGRFIGSGCYVNSARDGELLITSEHLFSSDAGNSNLYAVWKILPREERATRCLDSVLFRGTSYARRSGEKPDVIALKLGTKPKPLGGFFVDPPGKYETGLEIRRTDRDVSLTSLTTGLKARVVGFASSRRDNGATYMVIENDALGGESGSGFVDEHDNLYILSGGIELTTKLSKEKLATDKPLRLVYGPLKIE